MVRRVMHRVTGPALAAALVLSSLTALLALVAFYQANGEARAGRARMDALEKQVRALGGDPDAPVVINVRPPARLGPAPAASPTTRSDPPVYVTVRPAPQPSPSPSRTPSRSPAPPRPTPTRSTSPSPSTLCTPRPVIGGCL